MFPFPFSFFGASSADIPLELIDNNFAMEFDGHQTTTLAVYVASELYGGGPD